jgi:hypothetical protein
VRQRTSRAVAATVVASLAAFVAALLPWLEAGRTHRSAFALARSADAIGFVDTPGRRVLVASWYLLPLLVAAVWTAGALGRPILTGALGVAVGSMSVAAGSMVWRWVGLESGPAAALGAGALTVASGVWLLILCSKRRRTT